MKESRINKSKTPIEEICENLPSAFARLLNYSRALKFEDKPWIKDIKKLFIDLLASKGYEMDYQYDWIVKKNKVEYEISTKSDNKTGTTAKTAVKKKIKSRQPSRKRNEE